MGKTVKQGWGPGKVFLFLLLIAGLIASAVFFIKLVAPEVFENFANEQARLENERLREQLNATRGELVETEAERDQLSRDLREAQSKKILWSIVIAAAILGIIIVVLWVVASRRARGLKLEEAEVLFLPKARKRGGFPEDTFPGTRLTSRSYERVKKGSQNDKDERIYFIEYEFIPRRGAGFIHGLRAHPRRTVTVALLNYTWEYGQAWFPWKRLEQSLEMAHKHELWGFHLQKSKQVDDLQAAIQDARSVSEIKEAYRAEEPSGAEAVQ